MEALLPRALPHGFDYLCPAADSAPGTYIEVPLGRKSELAIIWGEGTSTVDPAKIKTILHAFPLPPMPEPMRRFMEWVAWYTFSPLGNVLDMALFPPAIRYAGELAARYSVGVVGEKKLTPAQKKVLSYLETHGTVTHQELANISSPALLKKMTSIGLLKKESLTQLPVTKKVPTFQFEEVALNPEQQEAADHLKKLSPEEHHVVVLEGITGSGKTEVYFELIESILKQGRQALVLVPEIALTVQWTKRCEKRFGLPPTRWHSALPPAERRDNWLKIVTGEARLIVGARSALFLPAPNLGGIIIDEEHDGSYKQEDGVIYHARDMAIVRARQEKIPLCLVSATPSLETIRNIDIGKYTHLTLTNRYQGSLLPETHLIDMRPEKLPSTKWLSPTLVAQVVKTLKAGEQVLLFLNRRGYAPLLLCRACGHRLLCPNCSAWMVTHRNKKQLQCHHCDHTMPLPKNCPSCEAEDKMVPIGPGVERIEEEVKALFPNASIATLSSDDTDSPAQLKEQMENIIAGSVDIIIGTQIMAKGHHFPHLTLVGIIDADLGLKGGDLRTIEKTYQLLHQLSGRAGREEKPGHVFLQTYQPEHPLMQALLKNDNAKLIAEEKRLRQELDMPPYGKLAAIILENLKEEEVKKSATMLARLIPSDMTFTVLGPAPAALYRLRGYYRMRFLIKSSRDANMQEFIGRWLEKARLPSGTKCKVDIDPQSFL